MRRRKTRVRLFFAPFAYPPRTLRSNAFLGRTMKTRPTWKRLLSRARFLRHYRHRQSLRMPDDYQLAPRSHLRIRQQSVQIVHTSHRFLVERNNDVALPQTRGPGGTASLHPQDHHATLSWKTIETHHPAMNWYRLRRNANPTAPDPTVTQQPASHELRGIDPDRKTNSLCRKNRRRIHTDHRARGIHERPTGIPGIQSRIRLNHVLDQPPRVRP